MSGWRILGTAVTAVVTVGTTLVFLFVAAMVSSPSYNCEDGCSPGSRWAPGAWGSVVQVAGLAIPATLAACTLVWAVATGRRRAALWSWLATTCLLSGWCIFTGAANVSISFSQSNSHWMWLAGLLVASGSGAVGVISTLASY